MELELRGRRALVTGSNSGIGKGIARMLIDEGASVVIHGRDRARAIRTAEELGAAGVALGDLTTDDGAESACDAARAALGDSVEILVNNAGGSSGFNASPFLDVKLEEGWIATYQKNTLAAVRTNLRLVPAMVDAGFGRVIHIVSAVATQPNRVGVDYSAAKAAMVNLTVSMAGSLAGTGVTVNTVQPGVIRTDAMFAWARKVAADNDWGDLSDDELDVRMAESWGDLPAGRLGRVDEVARVVCLLASPLMGFVTAANYRVDGGQIRSIN